MVTKKGSQRFADGARTEDVDVFKNHFDKIF
jgi:hypothetical protein